MPRAAHSDRPVINGCDQKAAAEGSTESAWMVAQGAEQGGSAGKSVGSAVSKGQPRSRLHVPPAGWPGASVELSHSEPVSLPSWVPGRHCGCGRKQDRPRPWPTEAYVLLGGTGNDRARGQMKQSAPDLAVHAVRREGNEVMMWAAARVAFQRWSRLTWSHRVGKGRLCRELGRSVPGTGARSPGAQKQRASQGRGPGGSPWGQSPVTGGSWVRPDQRATRSQSRRVSGPWWGWVFPKHVGEALGHAKRRGEKTCFPFPPSTLAVCAQ